MYRERILSLKIINFYMTHFACWKALIFKSSFNNFHDKNYRWNWEVPLIEWLWQFLSISILMLPIWSNRNTHLYFSWMFWFTYLKNNKERERWVNIKIPGNVMINFPKKRSFRTCRIRQTMSFYLHVYRYYTFDFTYR